MMKFPFFRPPLLSKDQKTRINRAIRAAEEGHRGEVQVFVEAHYSGKGPRERAKALFYELKMDKTKERTGILLYVAVKDKRTALWADEGLFHREKGSFWNSVVAAVAAGFREGRPVLGIENALKALQPLLLEAAPGDDHSGNELPDQVIVK